MVARTPSGGVKASARREAKSKGHTLPGTDKFPINNLQDLSNAKHDIGRTSEPRGKVVRYIDERAKALGGKPVGEHSDGSHKHKGHHAEHSVKHGYGR